MRKFLLFVFFMTSLVCFSQQIKPAELVKAQSQNSSFIKVNPFEFNGNSRNNLPEEIKEYSILKLSKDGLKSILSNTASNFEFTVPISERSSLQLQLVEVHFNDLIIRESSGKQVKYQGGRHFRGIVKGQESSLVAISVFEDDVMGFISEERSSGNLVLGKMEDGRDEFILYKDKDLLKSKAFECGTSEGIEKYEAHELENNDHGRALSECVRMYFEVDYNIYQSKGNNTTQTSNYVTGLYNQVATLYSNEQINTTISEIFIWTATSPYTGSTSSAMLNQFTAYRNGFNGNIAMLLSYSASGGIAYVNTLCNSNPDYRMSFSSISSSYSTVPTYSWSVEVVTHEFGHLLGSQHTHACAWNGNNTAIDGCYESEGSCPNPPIPSGGGTIMSYCHLTSAGINFNLGFGSQPGNLIRTKVTNATCLDDCPGSTPPSCTDGIQNGNETGVDCGGSCPPCNTGCSSNTGTLTLKLDNYPSETTWNIKNSAGASLYSGGPYNSPNAIITVALCLPNGCYTFNIFDTYGDGICCSYGQGYYNVVVNGTTVATGGQFTFSDTKSFCLNTNNTPTCTDGIKNGNETGIDCGGSCPACPTCTDGIKNGNETGVDCGGSCPVCPTCTDGVKNGNETGIDCGGSCPACPTCTDGIKNGNETGVDCGGTCPPCNNPPSCTDGIKNGNETGVDCGGSCPACPSCTDGVQNGNETGIDCGGSCPACPSSGGTVLGAYYFETGWDSWVDGGDDALRYQGNRSYEGNYSISLRDNSLAISSMTSPVYNGLNYLSMSVKFNFYAYSMESGEDFWLQYSSNGGSSWTTVGSYVNGTNFNNNTFYESTVVLNSSSTAFTNNIKFRFVCDASTNTDLVYIDAVIIKGFTTSNLEEGNEMAALAELSEPSEELNVYPNPANSEININLSGYEGENIDIKIYDLMGRTIYQKFYPESKSEYKISTAGMQNGFYIIKVSEDGELINTTKIAVQK